MTSKESYKEAYAWIWLPGETKPVVAGILQRIEAQLRFKYDRNYLARNDAIGVYDPELPLQWGEIPLADGLSMPDCIRDGSPDAWGRRALISRRQSVKGEAAGNHDLGELACLLESGSDRAGALDFQTSASSYVPRGMDVASLDDLLLVVDHVEKGVPVSPALTYALEHCTSLGGARPKAILTSGDKKLIAKFSMSTDIYSVVKAEYVAMRLASLAGLNVASVRMEKALGKDVLLVDRFDRERLEDGWGRKAFVSSLTMLELDEMLASLQYPVDSSTTMKIWTRRPCGSSAKRPVSPTSIWNSCIHSANQSAIRVAG